MTFSDVAPGHETDFCRWYESHLRQFVACPGFISAAHYEALDGPFHYVALYEMTSPEAVNTAEVKKVWGWGPFAQEVRNVEGGVYRRIFSMRPPHVGG
ncbi:MAG: hypothetical protein WDM84_07065 [Bauldia sp.]